MSARSVPPDGDNWFLPSRNLRPLVRVRGSAFTRTLYRSSALCVLTDHEQTALIGNGSLTYFDLRTVEESAAEPVSAHPEWRIRQFPLSYTTGLAAAWKAPEHYSVDHLVKVYGVYVDSCWPVLHAIVEWLGGTGDASAVVACSAGKDRTGVVAYLLMTALGAPAEGIAADYEASFLVARCEGSSTPFARSFGSTREGTPGEVFAEFTRQASDVAADRLATLSMSVRTAPWRSNVEFWNAPLAGFI